MKTGPLALTATVALALATAACDDLPTGNLKDPHTWGNHFLAKYAGELEVGTLEPGPAPLEEPRVVLLITGVTIPAAWFEPMKARLVRDGFIPVVYEPPDLLSGDLFENSARLAEVVDQVRADTGHEKIDVLAECTGGLIARHYIQSLGGERYVSRMVTFISPQNGLPKARLAASVAGWPALRDLTPGSNFLRTVNGAPLPTSVPITSIYSCTDEYIQPYVTSKIPGATNIGLCDRFIGHFQFFYDPEIYRVLHGALTAPLPSDGAPDAPAADEATGSGPDSAVKADDPGVPAAASDQGDQDQAAGCSVSPSGGDAVPGAGALLLLGALAALALRRTPGPFRRGP